MKVRHYIDIVSNTLVWRCLVLSNIVLTFLWLRHCQQLWCIFLSCYFFFVSYVISAADSCFQLDTSVLITRMRLLASLAAHRCSNLHTCTCTPTRGCLLNRRHAANVNCCCLIGVSVKTILLFLATKKTILVLSASSWKLLSLRQKPPPLCPANR